MSTDVTKYLRDAAEILGESATAVEVILAAEFIRQGYLAGSLIDALREIGVERARNPEPVELELAEQQGDAVTGTPSSVEFGFAPEPDAYWTEEDRQPARRRRGGTNV